MALPANPTGMKAVYDWRTHTVMVTWTPGAGATSVKLQRWVAAFNLYSDLTTVSGSAYLIDSSLTDGAQYAYRGLSVNAEGSPRYYGAPSNKVWIIDPPARQTGLTAQRNTNDTIGLNWTNHATTLAPIDHHYVKRQSNLATDYAQINRIAGGSVYYLDSRTEPDRRYRFRLWASNVIAGGAYYESDPSGVVYTTPKAPTNVRSRWVGDDILVEWDDLSLISAGAVVEHSTDGTTWDTMATLGKVKAWRHSAPERGAPHRHRVRVVSPKPTLGDPVSSGWGLGAWLTAQTTPNPPTFLGPAFAPSWEPFTALYRHNPVSPDSPDAGVQHRWRVQGGAWSAAINGPIVTANASAPTVIEVELRTKTPDSTYGGWSDTAAVPLRNRPTPNLTSPAAGATITGPALALAWSMPGQVAWEAQLWQGSTLVESDAGGVEKAATQTVEDGKSYTSKFRAFDGYLWSNWIDRTISTAFAAPGQPTLSIVVDEESYNATLSATGTAARFDFLRRRKDQGEDWEPVGSTTGAPVVDRLPPLGIPLEYVAIAWAANGSSTSSAAQVVQLPGDAMVVNYGPGLGAVAVLKGDIAAPAATLERETALHPFGRTFPVEVLGANYRHRLSVSGRAVDGYGSPRRIWHEAIRADLRWFRDPTGLSFRCSLSGLSVAVGPQVSTVSFSVEEVSA